MTWLKKLLNVPYISWRLIEWTIILGNLLSILISSNPFPTRPYLFKINILFSAVFLLLSLFFPIDRPIKQRRIYIAVQVIFIIAALYFYIGLEVLMYFVLAKSCFLLKRKDAISIMIAVGLADIYIVYKIRPQLILETKEHIKNHGIDTVIEPLSENILNHFIGYICICFFITILMFLLADKAKNEKALIFITLMESKSRKRAEKLTQDIKALTTVMERNRIARDIHDSLGHTLTTLGVQLELAHKLNKINPEKANQALINAQRLATQSLADVRNTVTAIRDQDFDLTQALISLCDRFQRDKIFEIKLQLNSPPIPLQTSHQIYCIIKEALYNIQKHSQADLVIIKSLKNKENIIIKIIDNGIGFDPQQIISGTGIKGMIERSHLINGQLTIDTEIGKGTIVQLTVNS